MSVGWSGADPAGFSDGASAHYELGTDYTANGALTITHVRVWTPVGGAAHAGRAARIWSAGGSSLASVALPDTMPSGWSLYALDTALPVASGASFVVSYSVTNSYGANTTPGYPRASGDTLLTATSGALNTNPGQFPSAAQSGAFYGVDVQYTATSGGNVVQGAVTLTTANGLTVSGAVPAHVQGRTILASASGLVVTAQGASVSKLSGLRSTLIADLAVLGVPVFGEWPVQVAAPCVFLVPPLGGSYVTAGRTFGSYVMNIDAVVLVERRPPNEGRERLELLVEGVLANTVDWALTGVDPPATVTVPNSTYEFQGTVVHLSKAFQL